MGVKGLWDILDSCKKTLPLHHLQNKRICVDLSCWMVQLNKVNQSHCAMKDKLYLKGLFHRIRALIALNCSLIFVTDGSIPGIKVTTYRRRLHLDNEGRDESYLNKIIPLQRNMGSEFSCMIKEAKILASALGVPCLDGIEEGEAQCALLDSESLCDGCFSLDSDIFLFGARTVYRDICLGEGGYVVCYEMDDIERKLGLGRNSLIALAVLLGCDYGPGVPRLGSEMACKIVKSFDESEVLQRIATEDLSVLKKANCSKKRNQTLGYNNKENIPPNASRCNNNKENMNIPSNGHKNDLPRNYKFLQVMDAYLTPQCHSADSQTVQRVLGMHSFQKTMLHQTCARFFQWPPEKTDEYILPKIAERDLRRFANLRHTSSHLGVQLPLDKMPVKCPVSGIIKRRKAQGKECFEVSWKEVDGLSSSIVPAELMERACPEKIMEFEERIAEKKKPKPRNPRPNKKSVNEIDAKLQQLMLEIEGAASSDQNYRLLDEPLSNTRSEGGKRTGSDQNNEKTSFRYRLLDEPLIDTRSNVDEVRMRESKKDEKTTYRLLDEALINTRSNSGEGKLKLTENTTTPSCGAAETEVVNLSTPLVDKKSKGKDETETEIIDLLSPLSVVCSRKHGGGGGVDVVELSESETEVSPEHARKARELRLFVASIRNE
ncbi:unnamed protein product [Lactuca virosa]|uniref:Flap endonuclease GEN-like 2 n=1 Tax=Lactuca virosa TaxID=75947 RepID=A0AAU9LYS1_9ASTR|nr:unnamed protein product [Lactuca virosa]